MTCRSTLGAILILGVSLLPLAAQAAAPLVVDETYRLQSGDVIIVSVLGEEKLSGSLAVGPGGSVAIPVIGSLQVAGKTLQETRSLLNRSFRDVIKEPFVTVALDEMTSKRRVYVSGAVEKPGGQMLSFGATPADALVAAGLSDDSDLANVILTRSDGQTLPVDLTGLRTHDPIDTTVVLNWDDRLYVPTAKMRLTVLGQVNKPGTYALPLGRKLHLVDALTGLAGGLSEGAGRGQATVLRPNHDSQQVDLDKLLRQGDLSQNCELQGGDVVIIPEADRITVAGEVTQPTVLVPGNRITVLEALVRSGGMTPQAGLKQCELYHKDGTTTALNLEGLWRRGDLTQNLDLQPGDVLLVPRAKAEEALVAGTVTHTGTVDLKEQEDRSLVKIVTTAGPLPNADLSRVSIYRAGQHLVQNLTAALKHGEMKLNVQVEPGDVVYVPDMGKVALLGGFSKPGLVDYDPQLTLLQYLSLGGLGGQNGANLSNGLLVRSKSDGASETFRIDASRMHEGILPGAVSVQPGDLIYFQQRGTKRNIWDNIRDFLLTAGGLRGLFN